MDWPPDDLSLAQLVRELPERPSGPPHTAIGFAWATVDVDRTLRDLAIDEPALGLAPMWQPCEEPLLGAAGRQITTSGYTAAILEPSTEGRLAAWLARNGEGLAVRYVPGPERSVDATRSPVTALGIPGWLEPPPSPRSVLVIVVDRPPEIATSAPREPTHPVRRGRRPSVDASVPTDRPDTRS